MGAQEQLDEGLGPNEDGAPGLETDQFVRALRVHELNLREIDLSGKTVTGHRVAKHRDGRPGDGPGDAQDERGVLSRAVDSDDHLPVFRPRCVPAGVGATGLLTRAVSGV